MKDDRNNSGNTSHVRHFNISDELYNAMEESRIKACLDISEQDLATYDNERALKFISIPVYRVHTQNPMLFCVDTEAPISCIGSQTLKRIVQLAGRKSIPMIESERDFQFGDTLIRSKGMVELIHQHQEA